MRCRRRADWRIKTHAPDCGAEGVPSHSPACNSYLLTQETFMQRREFLKVAAVAGVAAAPTTNLRTEAQAVSAGADALAWSTDMQYRPLGRTGEKVSVIGLGGYHIGIQPDPAESVRLIRTAIDALTQRLAWVRPGQLQPVWA